MDIVEEIKKLKTENVAMRLILIRINQIVSEKLGHVEANEVKREMLAIEHLLGD